MGTQLRFGVQQYLRNIPFSPEHRAGDGREADVDVDGQVMPPLQIHRHLQGGRGEGQV